ncbi:MAG: hypothetical protein JWQ09_3749 [Segetibacter sp.]|nr:hypothetical protein [Segetibacter sp.]
MPPFFYWFVGVRRDVFKIAFEQGKTVGSIIESLRFTQSTIRQIEPVAVAEFLAFLANTKDGRLLLASPSLFSVVQVKVEQYCCFMSCYKSVL